MFSGGMVSGPLLIGIFILAIVVLLLLIIKFKLNAFVALLLTAFGTGVLVNMPLPDVASTVTDGFGSTLGSIGMVTGLGVMLGKFMFESGGIESISNGILGIFGEKKSPVAVAISGFITGIPVFGDVVYIMFAPMLRGIVQKNRHFHGYLFLCDFGGNDLYFCAGTSDSPAFSCGWRAGRGNWYLFLLCSDFCLCRYAGRRYFLWYASEQAGSQKQSFLYL